jgi:hypothetical protein
MISSSKRRLSWMFAAVSRRASGMPRASVMRWRLEPARPRSVGLGPVSSPPFGGHAGAVDASTAPVDGTGPTEAVEQDAMVPFPDTGGMPVAQSPSARHARPATHLLGQHSQGMPLFNTNRMPLSVARCGIGGRPPFGFGRSEGSNGSIRVHNSSGTRGLAMPSRTARPYGRS